MILMKNWAAKAIEVEDHLLGLLGLLGYVLVIARCRVQYEKYFSSSFCSRNISRAEGD